MAEDRVEHAFWVVAPLIDYLGAQSRSNGIRQPALSIHHSNGFSHMPRTATAPVDAILKPIGGLSHVVEARENRQPSCMYGREGDAGSHAQSFEPYATREHRMDAMGYIEGMTDE